MAQKKHRGAYRTAIEYVLFVMGGISVVVMLVIGLGGEWFFNSQTYIHPGFRAAFASGPGFFLRIAASPFVLVWLFLGTLIYICGLLLQTLGATLLPRLLLGTISASLSGAILILLPPAVVPSLPALYEMILCGGFLGGLFGFLLYPRVGTESFQTSPLGRGHWALISAWILYLVAAYGHSAYQVHKGRSFKDPSIDFVYVKWTPAGGEIREEPGFRGDDQFPRIRENEIQELRAAGFTGILQACGRNNFDYLATASRSRMVIVMSRVMRETIDLPRPASGDILYIQTEQGWKVFPESAPTVPRTVRLWFSALPNGPAFPYTNATTDTGLGHPKPALGFPAFSWRPEDFQAPLPSLPVQKPLSK
jgi:hypothetical protein